MGVGKHPLLTIMNTNVCGRGLGSIEISLLRLFRSVNIRPPIHLLRMEPFY